MVESSGNELVDRMQHSLVGTSGLEGTTSSSDSTLLTCESSPPGNKFEFYQVHLRTHASTRHVPCLWGSHSSETWMLRQYLLCQVPGSTVGLCSQGRGSLGCGRQHHKAVRMSGAGAASETCVPGTSKASRGWRWAGHPHFQSHGLLALLWWSTGKIPACGWGPAAAYLLLMG